MYTALERHPIGEVLQITIPRWFLEPYTVTGVIQGMLECEYLMVAYRNRKGRKKTLMYRPGFLETMLTTGYAQVLWKPPYAKHLRKTGSENPLVSFPRGTVVYFSKNKRGAVISGVPPTSTGKNWCGKIIVETSHHGHTATTTIGTEQISSYVLSSWNASSFEGFDFPSLADFLPVEIEQDSFAPEGLSLS